MAIEASFTATKGKFPLAKVLEEFPAAQIELDRLVPVDGVVIPYFWLRDIDPEADINMDVISHPGINNLEIVDKVDNGLFVRIDGNLDYESVLTGIIETDVTLISAIGNGRMKTPHE